MESKRAHYKERLSIPKRTVTQKIAATTAPAGVQWDAVSNSCHKRVAQIPAGSPASRDTGKKRSSKSRAELLGQYPKELKAGAGTDICTPVFL